MEPFINLVKAPRALWGINVSYFIEGLAYFGVLTILAKFLAENVQLTDMHAGWVISGLTGGITLSMLFLGGVSDKIGVRAALIISLICMVVGRFFLALADSIGLATGLGNLMFFTVLLGLFIVVIGYGMYQPAAYAGVKKFTDKKTAGMGYAMIYALMNLGAFVSGMISPPIRRSFANAFPPNGLSAVMWTYVGMTVLAVFLCIIILTKKTEQTAIVAARQANGEDEKKTETAAPIKNKVDNTGLLLLASLSVVLLIVALFFWTNPAGLMYKFRWIP
ncbi:MFS transporter, partial [bacterium]|nr:MFS transporter [bacterium]